MDDLTNVSHAMSPTSAPAVPLVPHRTAISLTEVLKQALREYLAGRLPEAEKLYRAVLVADPQNPEAHHNLGMLALQSGKPTAGLPHFQIAWETAPAEGQYWLSFIDALIKADCLNEAHQVLNAGRQHGLSGTAVDQLELILLQTVEASSSPAEQEAIVGLFQAGHLDQARLAAEDLTRRFPNDGFAWKVLGAVLAQQGEHKRAWNALQNATRLSPHDAETHNTAGVVLQALGRVDEAIACYQRAVQLQPDLAQAHCNLGTALKDANRVSEAVASYRRAVAILPNYAEAHYRLGNSLRMVGGLDEAVTSYQRAVAIEKDFADAHNNLGNVLTDVGRLDEAIASYRRAVKIRPDYADAHYNLGIALQNAGRLDEALERYRRAIAIQPKTLLYRSNLLFLYAFTRVGSFQEEFREARQWEQAALSHAEREAARQRTFANPPRPGRPLRVGIVSAELGQHAVSYFLTSFLRAFDRQRVRVLLYPTTLRPEAETQTLRALAEGWTPLMGRSDADAAALIRAQGIDILLDTTGHTQGCRLGIFAHRAAPVQCHYIGYAGTTGLTEMDYFLADPVLIPP
ncbi:MAG: tetratricopeptide repeat protein, partial [Pirellulaceae bacterium]